MTIARPNAARALMKPAILRLLPLSLALGCIVIASRQLAGMDWPSVASALQAISPGQWALALAGTAASFWSMAQYDLIAHRHLGTGIAEGKAARTGAASVAVGQFTGLGPFVGAALRWRQFPALPRGRIAALTAFVTTAFFAAWALIALVWALPTTLGLAGYAWASGLAGTAAGLAGLAWAQDHWPQAPLPSLPAALGLLWWCFADLICAAFVFYALMPADVALAFWPFAAAVFLALGLGLIGGTPGGIGPFEVALLGFLPHLDLATLAATVLAYRCIYQALPAVLGMSYAFLARPRCDRAADPVRPGPCSGTRPEMAITAQSPSLDLSRGAARACALIRPNALVLFLGTTRGRLEDVLPALKAAARARNRVCALYKVGARDAALLRSRGWLVRVLAHEAVIDPARFDQGRPAYRQLRRMLRKAESAGVTAGPLPRPDWPGLARVQAQWLARNGAERGLTMGRYCPAYLSDKPLFGAWQGDRLIAFASFLQSPAGLSLDLLRQADDAPTGTQHLLIATAIEQARACEIPEVCLAAVPPPSLSRLAPGAQGLIRFKRCFGPRWRPLYIAAPGWSALLLAGFDLWRGINRPGALVPASPGTHWIAEAEPDGLPEDRPAPGDTGSSARAA